jgi:superfamily II DNA or RNA helicase
MQLRPYQDEATQAAIAALGKGVNPVLQLATGTGKSLIIAAIASLYRAVGKNTWVLTHVQQLVKQNAATYTRYSELEPAIVCAGLNRKDVDGTFTFGTIQSMMGVLAEMQAPDLIIIDEAHRVPHNEGEPTLYESILRRYPSAQRVAMTATPWRMDNGIIYGDGDQFWFDRLAYNYPVPRAVHDGWLCPLVGVETAFQLNLEDVSVSGDFVQTEVGEKLMERLA